MGGGQTGQCLEQLATLNFLAGCTKRVRLLTSVMVVPHRQPVLAAKMLATADILSGGRIIVGCGAGWMKEEFEAVGAPDFKERGRVTDEYIEAFKELWTKDRPRYQGRHVAFDNILFRPKPVQQPHPPVWIGGESEAAMKRAIRLGEGWYPASSNPANRLDTAERTAKAIDAFKAMAKSSGRDPKSIALAHVVLWPVNWTAEDCDLGRPADPHRHLGRDPRRCRCAREIRDRRRLCLLSRQRATRNDPAHGTLLARDHCQGARVRHLTRVSG